MKTPVIFLIVFFSIHVFGQVPAEMPRYIKTPGGYMMVLRKGDQLFKHLESLMEQEQIPFATFTGMGFAEAEFGFFNSRTKQYRSKRFKAGEIASMQGTIAWQEGKPSVHAHGILCDKRFKTHGGHILSATVGTGTLEIVITVHDKKLERKKDESIGANVLSVEK